MSTGLHRLVVIACALSWFLVGMHSPIVHQIIGHGAAPRWSVLVLLAVFAVMALASVWVLLRLRDPIAGSVAEVKRRYPSTGDA